MHEAAMEVVARIADHLLAISYQHRGQSTWLATTQHEDPATGILRHSHGTIGPNVYGGTSGIALFLAEAALRTGDRRHAKGAIAAAAHALARASRIGSRARFGFYTGVLGIGHVARRVGELLDRPDLLRSGTRILLRLSRDEGKDPLQDVITGAAGSGPIIAAIASKLGSRPLTRLATRMGRSLLRTARKDRHGWSWGPNATGFESPRNLTGFAHGAAGFGWALLELHGKLGHRRFLAGATGAFRYERRWFRKDQDNWPDFRETASKTDAPCRNAWCHGGPGIGLSRLRAYRLLHEQSFRTEAAAATRSSLRAIRGVLDGNETDTAPCHGFAGIAEFLLESAATLNDEQVRRETLDAASLLASRYASTPSDWPCGVSRGHDPSLMLGLAGVGYFYLRLADPRVPSILLPGTNGVTGEPNPV